nr:MAG TPA: hypothetical protein [Caudoviricetes sp.]
MSEPSEVSVKYEKIVNKRTDTTDTQNTSVS